MNRDRAKGIVQRLSDIGAITPGTQAERVIDEVHSMVHDDFIPGGKRVTSATNLRPAPAGNRCGIQTGNDIQSGPFYCGGTATLIGDTDDGIVCACARHESIIRRIAE